MLHWSDAPTPDWVAVAVNVPRAAGRLRPERGLSEGAFMVAIRPISGRLATCVGRSGDRE